VVHVEAKNETEAEEKALTECHEEYEKYYDATITEEEDRDDPIGFLPSPRVLG